MGVPQGGNLGTAHGAITINTAQLAQAQAAVNAFAQQTTNAMGGVGQSVSRAQASINGFSLALQGLGLGLGLRELTRAAVESERIATAFDRQSVAARNLAGSQAQVNALLEAYRRATGDAVDDATALADVTRLLGIGFADSVQEIEAFTRAVRGISIATGRTQDQVSTQLQLEMLNRTGFRLDQVGLSVAEVNRRYDMLRATTRGLTEEQAYQQAVLEAANEKYGDLTKSAEAQATGVEQLTKAWKDFNLQVGQVAQGPINFLAEGMAHWLNDTAEALDLVNDALVFMGQTIGVIDRRTNRFSGRRTAIGEYERDRAIGPMTGTGGTPNAMASPDAMAVQLDWARGVSQLNRQLNREIIDQERSYGAQRRDAVNSFQQTIAREAEDFARNRARQEQDLARSILDVRQDAAQREQRMAEDLARTIGQAQSDSAERLADLQADLDRRLAERRADSAERSAEWEEDRDEAIAERRKDSADRILELEEDFARAREQRQRQYELSLEEAAARGDGRAVYRLQQRHELEEKEAQENHAERLADEREKLQEAIDQLNESHRERLADEQKALDKAIQQAKDAHARQVADEKEALNKRIAQANEAHQRQLEDARAADEQRIADMQADFEERTRRENEDRATRLQRMAQDHQDSLNTLDSEHAERLAQIKRHAAEERAELDEQAKEELLALGVRNAEWLAEQARKEGELEALWDKFMAHVTGTVLEGPTPGPGSNPVLDARRQQLRNEIDERRAAQEKAIPGSPEWSRLANEIIELQRALDALEQGGPGVGMASLANIANTSRFTMPSAAMGATGTGGNISLSIGQMVLQGANPNDPQAFIDDFNRQLVRALRTAKGQI